MIQSRPPKGDLRDGGGDYGFLPPLFGFSTPQALPGHQIAIWKNWNWFRRQLLFHSPPTDPIILIEIWISCDSKPHSGFPFQFRNLRMRMEMNHDNLQRGIKILAKVRFGFHGNKFFISIFVLKTIHAINET